MNVRSAKIMLIDDDDDDRLLMEKAFEQCRIINDINYQEDGQAALDHLLGTDNLPDIILLDLNMPKMDGQEFLKEKNKYPRIKDIPVVILTTSKQEEDILKTYNLGVKSYIVKPVDLESLTRAMQVFEKYWFEIVILPPNKGE